MTESIENPCCKEARHKALMEALNKVPANWLDPLLTGPIAIFDDNAPSTSNVQNICLRIRERISSLLFK